MSTKTHHAIIILFFLLLSIFLTVGRVGTGFSSFALLTPDLGVYASIVAAQDHPDLFAADPFLSNEKNTNSYNMVFIPVIKTLNKLFGNYGTACIVLLPFFLFIHLIGYYLLGISIFKDPWAGLIVSLLLSTPTTTAYDFWGLLLDALPRFMYQSLIPLVLLLSIRFGKETRWWPVILGSVGLLNYVHPLSTPPWTAAIVLALWVSVPELSFREKLRKMTIAGVFLLLILSPFISNYLQSTVIETGQVVDYDQTVAILRSHISSMNAEGFLSPIVRFFRSRTGDTVDLIWILLWLAGSGSLAYGLYVQKDSPQKSHLRQIAAWMLGIFLVGGIVPSLEQILFAYLRRIPPEFEIIRTLRYLAPLFLLATLYAFWLAADTLKQKGILAPAPTKYVFEVAGIFLLVVWGISSEKYRVEFRDAIRQNISCLSQGRMLCELPAQSMDFIDMMNSIQEKTPVGSSIFSEGQEVAIRYYALRPLAFTYKDGAPLAYTDPQKLPAWSRTYEEMDELSFIRKFPFRRKRFIMGIAELARANNADYLLIREPFTSDMYVPNDISLVYANGNYSLFKINKK